MDINLAQLNGIFGNRSDAYNFVSFVYYLPPFEYKGLTKEYLEELVKEPCPYFKIEKEKIHPQHVHYRKHTASFLLSHLEDFLFSANFKPTGFLTSDPPPLQWLYDVILSLEPEDILGLLSPQRENIMEQAIIKIDPR